MELEIVATITASISLPAIPGALQSFAGRLLREIHRLDGIGSPTPLNNAGALTNPFVRRVNRPDQVVVGDREVTTGRTEGENSRMGRTGRLCKCCHGGLLPRGERVEMFGQVYLSTFDSRHSPLCQTHERSGGG